MGSPQRGTLKLPRLRTKDELLRTSPELFNKLLLGEDMNSARSTSPQTNKTIRAAQPAGSSSLGRATSAHRAGAYDTPRGFGDEPLTVDQELAIELESVKRERQQLLESISQVKAESGTAGGEAQQADIKQLLKELELKKAKLNELKGESRKNESAIAKIRDDDTDAQRLTPDDNIDENSYIQELRDEMTRVEEDLLEADAKNRLYYLLGERTRREHMAIDQKVREKQDSKHACLDDLANLTEHLNATRAAKELAEKELAKTKRQVEEARGDWMRKIRERRAEVRELKKRQQKEREKEVHQREMQLEKEKAERAAQAKLKMEQQAYELQVASLAPRIEAMEASWNRLRAISGGETPNEVVEYWQGLKAKEQRMRELVTLAEQREAACKAEISQLLASRSAMFESSKQAAAVAAAAAAAAQEAAEKAKAEGPQPDEDPEAANARIEAAEKRMDAAQVQFNKLRSICVAAEQGLRSLLQRLMIALEEVPTAAPSAAQTLRSPSGVQHGPPAVSQSGSRLQSAGASSTTGSHAADTMRRSQGGAASAKQGRTTRDLVDPSLAAKANRLSSSRSRDTRSAASSDAPGGAIAGSNLAAVAEDASSASLGMDRPPVAGLPLNHLGAPNGRPNLPSRGKNTIDDDTFLDSLGQLLAQVTERLEKLLEAGENLDIQALKAAAVAASESSGNLGASSKTTPCQSTVAAAAQQAAAAAGQQKSAGDAADSAAAAGEAEAAAAVQGEESAAAEGEAADAEKTEGADGEAAEQDEQQGAADAAEAENAAAGPEATGTAGVPEQQTSPDEQQLQLAAGSRPESASGAAAGDGSPSGTTNLASTVPAAALAVGGNANSNIPESEKALMKGLYRRTWTGAPWLDAVSDNPLDLNLVPSMKRKKGKKKEAAAAPDLSRIMGYTPPNDAPAESDDDDDDENEEENNTAEGVVDRDWIKMRAAKMTARHNAKQAAAAAAAQQNIAR